MRSLAIAAGALILSATSFAEPPPAPPMPAKDAPAAEELADLVVETMRSLRSIAFDAEYEHWEGGELLARSRGSVLIESAEFVEGMPRFIVRGESTDPDTGEVTAFTHAFDGEHYFLIDDDAEVVHINRPDRGGTRLADSRRAVDGLIFLEFHYANFGRAWRGKYTTPIDRGPDPLTDGRLRMLFPRFDGIDFPLNWWWRVDAETGLFHGYDFWWPDTEDGPPAGFQRLLLSDVRPNAPIGPGSFGVEWPDEYEIVRDQFPPFDESLDDHEWTNRLAPDWEFRTADGEVVRPSDARERVTLVYFWSRACEPCIEFLPDLQAIYEELHEFGLDIVAVNTWDNDLRGATDFLRDKGCTFTSVESGTLHIPKFGSRGLPNWLLLGPDGELRARKNSGDLETLIRELLATLNTT